MIKKFLLPDLGEGLPDATIVEWYVKEGDTILLDQNLVSMETAKAVVDVPSPVSGKVLKLAGGPGDVIATGALLAEFEIDPNLPQRRQPARRRSPKTPAPWSVPCRWAMRWFRKPRSRWAVSKRCRRCAPWHASWAWISPACVPAARTAR